MAKYIIEFNDEANKDLIEDAYYSCKQIPWWGVSEEIVKRLTPYTEPDRKSIEDEAWKFIRKFCMMEYGDIRECYKEDYWSDIFEKYTYSEAKAKYEAWKKEKEEIHVGDEVELYGRKSIVVYVGADEVYHLIDETWIREVVQGKYQLTKTGRHFDEVEKLLERMKAK